MTLIERRNTTEHFRDVAADLFERHTGPSWRPRSGSMVNHRTLTADMIDSASWTAQRRPLGARQLERFDYLSVKLDDPSFTAPI